MPKKLAQKIVKQAFEMPGQVAQEAAQQVGVIPKKEGEETKLTKEGLEKKAAKKRAESIRKASEIEAEIAEMVERRRKEERLRRETMPVQEKGEKQFEPLVEPKPKRPRGFLAGVRQKLKTWAEFAGRRVGE